MAFALGLSNSTAQQLSNPTPRRDALDDAHKLLFNLAINKLQSAPQHSSSDRIATFITERQAFTTIRAFTILVECSLGFVAYCSLALMVLSRKRVSHLTRNVASFEDVAELLPTDETNLRDLTSLDDAPSKVLEKAIQGGEYKLRLISGVHSTISRLSTAGTVREKPVIDETKESRSLAKTFHPESKAVWTLQMTHLFGLAFITTIAFSLIGLVVLRFRIAALNGKRVETIAYASLALLLVGSTLLSP